MIPNHNHRTPPGVYVITPSEPPAELELAEAVSCALAGGASLVQYRDKSTDPSRRRLEANALLRLCRAAGVPLIVNDDLHLAAELGADGVHLGRDDPSPATARAILGPSAIIGVSCYNDLRRAAWAAQEGADYLAFGRFFPSRSKPLAVQADPSLLRAGKAFGLPLVAIGGITPENGPSLLAAGADLLAVIEGVFGQTDITAACRRLSRLFPD
jgi:thiamine-phosphate pyrophosphorylase